MAHPSVKSLLDLLSKSDQAATLVENLSRIHERFTTLDATLNETLAEYDELEFSQLAETFSQLREEADSLAELSPILAEMCELPDFFTHALRHAPVPLDDFEAAIGHKSVNRIYREDRAVSRFESRFVASYYEYEFTPAEVGA